jgi:ubiquitin carboxyl-terminal hydrolase 16/45
VQKFLLSEPAPPRPSSVPPPDTSHAQRAAIPEPSADSRRLSLERDPTPIQISAPIVQPKPIVLEESSEKLTKLGRRVSLAWNKKKGKEREDSASSPGEDDTEMEDIRPSRPPTIASGASSRQPSRSPSPNPKKALQNQRSRAEAEYLRSLLSDNQGDRPLNPFSYLPPGAGILSKLAPSQGLEHCLRQFTAVELLDGENAVGCRRCWKIANGLYRPKDHEVGEGASAEHGESQWTHTIESSRSVSPASTGVISPRPDVSLSAFDLASSRSSLPSTYAPVERPLQPHPIQIPQITTEAPRSPSPQLEDARPTFARSYSEGSTAVNPDNSLKAPDPRLRMSRSRSTIAYDNDSASGQSSEENSDNESNTSAASDSEPPRRKHKIKEVLMRRAYKRYLIAKPPPVLVVHLKRFQQVSKSPSTFFGNLKKVDDYIQFPEYLDLSGFLAPSPSDFGLARGREGSAEGVKSQERREELSTYRLVAVVVHIGNMVCLRW